MVYDPYSIGSRVYDRIIEPFLKPLKRLTTKILREKFTQVPGAHVLEVACGTGTQSYLLAREGIRVVALDKSYGMIKQTQKKEIIGGVGGIASIRADASYLPFSSAVFDAVVFQLALHEMKNKIREHSAREIKRVAKENAIFIMADFVHAKGFTVSKYILAMVELMAGREHFCNGREFIRQGGLLKFLDKLGLQAEATYPFFDGNIQLAVARNKRGEF